MKSALVWFRRDLRLFDHAALHHALRAAEQVYCCFVFDTAILSGLPRRDRRVTFIYDCLQELIAELHDAGGHLIVRHGDAQDVLPALAAELGVQAVFCNDDYEPAAIARDKAVAAALERDGLELRSFKDQVIFDRDEVLSQGGTPFSVFTPYKNAWLKKLDAHPDALAPWGAAGGHGAGRFAPGAPGARDGARLPSLEALGFERTEMSIPAGMSGGAQLFDDFLTRIAAYGTARDYPAVDGCSQLSVHLRFGTVSIRHLVRTVRELSLRGQAGDGGAVWLSELIWREFYKMILYFHPHVVDSAFKPAYDAIEWETGAEADEAFAAWCEGRAGYPLVDAAMKQINATGYMHNRLRMVTASFLVKDLGIDWKRGEAYFAEKLNDFDLSSNSGGWQWAASSGCDAQPYFRIVNPVTQSEKFDPDGDFIRQYLPQLGGLSRKEIHAPWGIRGLDYPQPIVQHDEARKQTLARYEVVKRQAAGPQ
jgi:deoxyribodipyrimidine photo-lyase